MRSLGILNIILLVACCPFTGITQPNISGYTTKKIAGYTVFVEQKAESNHGTLTQQAIDLLQEKLTEINNFCIDQEIKDSLKNVPFFVDWNTAPGAVYHPSAAWLIANGRIKEKAKSVEIANISNFIDWTKQNQPYMVLHELAHAYHHRVHNFNETTISNAYNNAMSNGLYQNVSYHSGGGNYSTVAKAYGLNNEMEFFAEISEAYFGLNDFYPFTKQDLKVYDPIAYNCAVKIWGENQINTTIIKNETTISSKQENAEYQWLDCSNFFNMLHEEKASTFIPKFSGEFAAKISFNGCLDTTQCVQFDPIITSNEKALGKHDIKIYPNPINETLYVESSIQIRSILIYNIQGQLLFQKLYNDKKIKLNIDKFKSGLHFIIVNGTKAKKISVL